MRAVFIVNPASDGGRTGKAFLRIAAEAAARGVDVVEWRTAGPGDATALARRAAEAGEHTVVAVGGDGTVNEVINGLVDPTTGLPAGEGTTRLGLVMRGTGCDTIRTYGISKRVDRALDVVATGRERPIDIGRLRCLDAAGNETCRLFANAASCGMTGNVAERANAAGNRFGGTPGFLIATVQAFSDWTNTTMTVTLDGVDRVMRGNSVICANGRYLGGGIKPAPDALPDDGLFDVVLIGDVGKADLIRNVHRLYLGTLEKHPRVEVVRARTVRVTPERRLPLECDGELPGFAPADFDVLPGAVRLLVPR